MRLDRLFFALIASVTLGAAGHAAPVTLDEVLIGEDLAEKADEYGQRDIDRLADELTEAVAERLTREGHGVGEDGDIRIALTLEDAWPNRPTREQLSDRPGLSMQSISLGGASVSAVLFDASGAQIGEIEYRWRTHHISDSAGRTTWTDAERTFDRFARNLAEALADQSG
jgi:hypothetical protein